MDTGGHTPSQSTGLMKFWSHSLNCLLILFLTVALNGWLLLAESHAYALRVTTGYSLIPYKAVLHAVAVDEGAGVTCVSMEPLQPTFVNPSSNPGNFLQ